MSADVNSLLRFSASHACTQPERTELPRPAPQARVVTVSSRGMAVSLDGRSERNFRFRIGRQAARTAPMSPPPPIFASRGQKKLWVLSTKMADFLKI